MKRLLLALLLGFSFSLQAQLSWQHTNGPEGGYEWYPAYNDQYAFFPDQYHLYRTSDGQNWEKLPMGSLWPIAVHNSTLVAQQGYRWNTGVDPIRLVISPDNGETWVEGTYPPIKSAWFSGMVMGSQGIYVLDASTQKLYRSQDDALTWEEINKPGEATSHGLWVSEDRVYMTSEGKLWRLATNGIDWEMMPITEGPQYVSKLYISGSNILIFTGLEIWASADNGLSWHTTLIEDFVKSDFVRIGNRIYLVYGLGLFFSEDMGFSWNEIPTSGIQWPEELAAVAGQLLCFMERRGVFRLNEANNEFIEANNGLGSGSITNLDITKSTLWAASGSAVFAYDINNREWVDKALLPLAGQRIYPQISISKSGRIATFQYPSKQCFLSSDEGVSWDSLSMYTSASNNFVRKLYWLDDVLMAKGNSQSFRSTDFGQSWQEAHCPRVIVEFKGKYYGLDSDQFSVSTDLGLSWQMLNGPDIKGQKNLLATPDKLFIIGEDESLTTLYISSDGEQWQYANDGLPNLNHSQFPVSSSSGGMWNINGQHFLYDSRLFVSSDTCKTWAPVDIYLKEFFLADSIFFAGSRYGGGVIRTAPPEMYNALSGGVVYQDDNNNGIQDVGEIVLPNIRINVKEPKIWHPLWSAVTEADGRYEISHTVGANDTLRVQMNSDYIAQINPPLHIITDSGTDRDFGIHFKPDITDVAIAGNHDGRPRSGSELYMYLFYTNEGTSPASGTISLKLDPDITYTGAEPPPSALIGTDSLVWDFSQLPILSHQRIRVSGFVDPHVPPGNVLETRAHIVPSGTDFTPANNHFLIRDTMVAFSSPNEKRVEPARGLTMQDLENGTELKYTILFQNTGNQIISTVRITDLLDTALLLGTLRLVASSHDITSFNVLPGGLLEIVLDDIALPTASSSDIESRGFVTFAIQRNRLAQTGWRVRNRAAIYFDSNEPVVTNTVVTRIVAPLVSTSEPDLKQPAVPSLIISPNPTKRNFRVDTEGRQSGPGTLEVVNMAGQVCFRQQVADLSQPLEVRNARLSEGLYIVRSSGRDGVLTGKLAVQGR